MSKNMGLYDRMLFSSLYILRGSLSVSTITTLCSSLRSTYLTSSDGAEDGCDLLKVESITDKMGRYCKLFGLWAPALPEGHVSKYLVSQPVY